MNKKFVLIGFIALLILAAVILDGGFRFSDSRKNTNNINLPGRESGMSREKLSSFFTSKNDYDSAFSKASGVEKRNVLAGITSHHFLAKDLIARFFSGIKDDGIQNIIIAGPDHRRAMNATKADAVTTKLSWTTPYGELDPDIEMQDKILAADNVIEDDHIFLTEHSVYTLVPFAKKVFPNARVIPLVIRNNNDYEKFIALGSDIRKIAGDKTLLIISSDFSHNSTVAESQKNDQASIGVLKNLNENNISGITSDCRACVAFLYGFLKGDNTEFFLVENKNSSDFGGEAKDVTSYVSGYFLSN